MEKALSILGTALLALAFLSLLISRRLGDRVQSCLVLVVGLLGFVLYLSDIALYGASTSDWIGLGVSGVCVALGADFIHRRR